MRLQRDQPFDDTRPFTRADARAAGLPVSDLLTRRYRRLFHDVHVRAGVRLDVRVRAATAIGLNARGSYASHATAAEIWGGVVPERGPVHVSVPDGQPRSERRGIRAHRALPRPEVRLRSGVRVSAPGQALLEMAVDGVDLVDLVVAADSLLRAGALDLDELRAAASQWTGRGSRLARRAAGLARKGVHSAMESRLRLLIVLAGLPEPEVNHRLRDEVGTTLLRFDLSYPALKLLIEYDGRQHAENEAQWKRDVRRRELIDRLDLRLLVVLHDGIYERPLETLDRVATALRERGVRVRRAYKPEWERYFPGRTTASAR
jgi:very-short-patch-repair endonuclease